MWTREPQPADQQCQDELKKPERKREKLPQEQYGQKQVVIS